MKVLVAGATGALGKQLVPRLVAARPRGDGHDPQPSKRGPLRELGATPVVVDALDPDAVAQAVAEAEPEVIVHQLTALSESLDMRHFDRDFAADQPAAHRGDRPPAGRGPRGRASRGSWPRATPAGRSPGRRRRSRPRTTRSTRARRRDARGRSTAIRHLEDAVTGAGWTEGVVLRYGGFYGPGTSLAGRTASTSRRSASASSRWSATAPACGRSSTSRTRPRRRSRASSTAGAAIYNIVDDEPAPVARVAAGGWRRRRRASRRATCRAGSAGCSPARRRRS